MGLCGSTTSDGINIMGNPEQVRQWRDDVVLYRQRFRQSMERSQSLTTRRNDVYCECLDNPWKPGESYDIGDLFHSTFEKSTVEINMAFKGGRFNQHKAGVLIDMNYGRSIVLVLKSKSSGSVCCACLMVVHTTTAGEVFEMIWFATRERKQNQGLGTTLFRRACQAAKASGAKGLLVTANDNVALWWISLSKSVSALHLHPNVVRNGKTSDGLRRAADKGHDKRLRKVPKYSTQSTPDGVVNKFYTDCASGKPFRYGPGLTTHVWYLPAGSGGGGGGVGGQFTGKKGKSGGGGKGGGSKYASGGGKKRKSFRTAGTTVQAAVRFESKAGRRGSKSGR